MKYKFIQHIKILLRNWLHWINL